MARIGISRLEVQKARDLLISDGKVASVDAVRQLLGNTGSKSTIHRFLKELGKESGEAGSKQVETAAVLQRLVDELAAKLHTDADARLAQMRDEHEADLKRSAEAMAALQDQVRTLTYRLQAAEIATENIELAYDRLLQDSKQKPNKGFGLNLFSSMITGDRSGRQSRSLSNFFANSRSGAQTPNDSWLVSLDKLPHQFS